jgi:hypothetical protein
MQPYLRVFLLAATTAFLATPAFAHHPGGTGNPGGAGPVTTIPAETLDQGQVAAFVLYEYIKLQGLDDPTLVAAASRHEHAHSIGTIESTSLGAAFGITDDLTVSIRLPFVTRTDIREGTHSHVHGAAVNSVTARGGTSGIGDATVLGQWRFFNSEASGSAAAALFGLKLPTGKTNAVDRAGELFETEFQPGSGSTDVLAGLAATQRFGTWAVNASALYVFVNKGAQNTDLGDRFQYNAALSFRLFGSSPGRAVLGTDTPVAYAHGAAHSAPEPRRDVHTHADGRVHRHEEPKLTAPLSVDAVLELNGEWHDHQVIAGERDRNSGGNVVYLSPGIRISAANVSGFASIGVPVVNDMYGLQAKPSHRVLGGLAISF